MLVNQRGNAMVEIVPILALFILLVNFSLGFFGVIHSGILNSIGARNYAFETFRNRADLRYLRDTKGSENGFTYAMPQLRFHSVIKENAKAQAFEATRRPIAFMDLSSTGVATDKKGNPQEHQKTKGIIEGQRASQTGIDEGVDPVWIKTSYGICLTAVCGS